MIVSVNNRIDKILTLTFIYDKNNEEFNHESKVIIGSKYNISYKELTKNGTTIVSVVGRVKAFNIDDKLTRENTLPSSLQKPLNDMVVTISVDCSTEFNSKIIDIKTYDITDIKCLDPVIITPEVIDAVMATNTLCEYNTINGDMSLKFKDSDKIFKFQASLKVAGV